MRKEIIIYKTKDPKIGFFEIKNETSSEANIKLTFQEKSGKVRFKDDSGNILEKEVGEHKLPAGKYEFFISEGDDNATAILDINILTVYRNNNPKIDEFDIDLTTEIVEIMSYDGAISARLIDGPSSGIYTLGTHKLEKGKYSIIVEKVGVGDNPSITITSST